MRDRALLPEAGQFYKANLHCHTVLSDGRWTKEQVKEEYRRRGYSVVAFTDHRRYGWHPELMDETFIPLAAYEADLNEPFPPSGDFQRLPEDGVPYWDLVFTEGAEPRDSSAAAIAACGLYEANLWGDYFYMEALTRRTSRWQPYWA